MWILISPQVLERRVLSLFLQLVSSQSSGPQSCCMQSRKQWLGESFHSPEAVKPVHALETSPTETTTITPHSTQWQQSRKPGRGGGVWGVKQQTKREEGGGSWRGTADRWWVSWVLIKYKEEAGREQRKKKRDTDLCSCVHPLIWMKYMEIWMKTYTCWWTVLSATSLSTNPWQWAEQRGRSLLRCVCEWLCS